MGNLDDEKKIAQETKCGIYLQLITLKEYLTKKQYPSHLSKIATEYYYTTVFSLIYCKFPNFES